MVKHRIGELLVAEGLVTEATVNRALGFQRLSGERIKIGSILLNWDLLSEEGLLATLAKFHRCPSVDWPTLAAADVEVVRLLPSTHAFRFAAIPYRLEKGMLRVALINASDLGSIDEICRITGKRVAPGVTTEVRLLQAHQRFYGRHIPGGFRTIVQRLERKTAQTRRTTERRPAGDFRAPDLLEAAARVPISAEPALPNSDSLSPPELPTIAPPVSLARREIGSPSEALPPPAVAPPPPAIPLGPPGAPLPAPMRDDPIRSGEDPLTQWVGDALSAFQRERGVAGSSASTPSAAPPTRPAESASQGLPASPAEDVVSGMWRASTTAEAENVAAGMWTPGEEAGPRLWEARSREEIGEAVLKNALTHLPRVLLFGVGRSAVIGWSGRGPGVTSQEVASIRIPVAQDSVFSAVEKSGVPHFGPVEPGEWPSGLASLLGGTPQDCAIFPIRVLDGVAAFLYADRLGQPMQYQDFALIARAAASTANILGRFLLRSNAAPVG